MSASLRRVVLLAGTLSHLSIRQIASRSARIGRARWRTLLRLGVPTVDASVSTFSPLWRSPEALGGLDVFVRRGREIAAGRFTFLNTTIDFRGDPDWFVASASQLWRYHLHYFDYVIDLAAWRAGGSGRDAYETFRQLVRSWIRSNRRFAGDGWHPYTVSLRIVNWCHGLALFRPELEEDVEFLRQLITNLFVQARFVARNLETDVRGNHLIKNLKAMIWAGVVFESDESAKWFTDATRRLEREVAEQVKSDGGHFERAPGYHVQVLRDLLETSIWLSRNRTTPPWLGDAIDRMTGYLDQILPPNGRLPLFKDTAKTEDFAPVDILLAAGEYTGLVIGGSANGDASYRRLLLGGGTERVDSSNRSEHRLLADSGYGMVRDDGRGDFFIIDVGEVCPPYLPAHAHADMFSYELSVNGRPIVVDSGVYEYQRGSWRDYFRSTAAHNTVSVGGADQSEVWESFRVARRARIVELRWREDDGVVRIDASHDGYRRLRPPVVHRRTAIVGQRVWLIIDQLRGEGRTVAVNSVHLHPDLRFREMARGLWSIEGTALFVRTFGSDRESIVRGSHDPHQGWYSEEFGRMVPNDVLELHFAGDLPMIFGYCIAEGEPPIVRVGETIRVRARGFEKSFALDS